MRPGPGYPSRETVTPPPAVPAGPAPGALPKAPAGLGTWGERFGHEPRPGVHPALDRLILAADVNGRLRTILAEVRDLAARGASGQRIRNHIDSELARLDPGPPLLPRPTPATCPGFVPGHGFGSIRTCSRCGVDLPNHRIVVQ